ncbi:GNAT family N-acetyltransferase [Pseudarthrobacter sp. J64]|uniref:GNAT family N-acetyltransferase n=1 Tax=Pseudarthrobacter sp. J64 TaxID=3116485 RepID=UPI002E822FC5|nr:GNAT family N-acetyltransferase [Pseudarthrobacter sp. J64]MEE2570267.1 GNAT family N-acetyltransferase [Pseudarthrobacter sp. J64]
MVTVRAAETEDTQPIAALRATWAAEQDPAAADDPDYERAVADWMASNPRKFFVAEHGGQLIGMLNLMVFQRMPKPKRAASCWIYVGNVYVLPERRNAGIGAKLMEAAINFSESIGAVRIVLSPSAEAQTFYERLGFEPAGELSVRRLQ